MPTGLLHANNLIGCGGSPNKSDWAQGLPEELIQEPAGVLMEGEHCRASQMGY